MKIGIGVCTYNRLDRLQRCLQSIQETMPSEAELVIASDGSTDGTEKWLVDNKFDWVTGPNRGVTTNKNRLLARLDHCDCIFIIEDDIAVKPRWCENYVQTYQESGYQHFSFTNRVRRARKNATSYDKMTVIKSGGTTGQLMFITKDVLNRCGGFNQSYVGHGYGHLEYTKRINHAFGYGDKFYDSLQGNLCIISTPVKSASAPSQKGSNKAKYKFFKKRYKKMFDRFCYQPYKEQQ